MSRESYVRGFCKAAAAAGVDPEALAKYAQQKVPRYTDAIERNRRRADTFGHASGSSPEHVPYELETKINNNKPFTESQQDEMDALRKRVAWDGMYDVFNASDKVMPDDVRDRIVDNLIQQGIINERDFRRDKTIPYRAVPSMEGLEGIKFTKEELDALRGAQNRQVKNDRVKRYPNTAMA